jgi:RNA polymerase sigma-70 factor (ECF subfamily)
LLATHLDRRIELLSPELLAFLRRRTSEPEEIMQEVWLKVARANPDCEGDSQFRAYVYSVARRQLIDAHRRRQARVSLVALEPSHREPVAESSQDGWVDARGMLAVIERTLGGLKPEIAQVFRWRTTDTLSFKDIAARQGVPLNTALGRHHRAVKALSVALASAGFAPEGNR